MTRTQFPTRQTVTSAGMARAASHPFHLERHDGLSLDGSNQKGSVLDTVGGIPAGLGAAAPRLMRFVAGIDAAPATMSDSDASALGDLFSREVLLKTATPPRSVRELFEAVARISPPGLPIQQIFLVAEGGQTRLTRPDFELNARLVVTWQTGPSDRPAIMLSTVPAADDPQALMQLISWSEADKAFHFFERERTSGNWVWAGNSFHALDARSRGKGPFDSHINGGLVMKELKAPWAHWNSVSASIPPEAVPADSELRTNPLFSNIQSAHLLEPIVKTGVRHWTKSRVGRSVSGSRLRDVRSYLRQVLWCTSINLVSSTRVFGQPDGGRYPLPTSFFYDFDAIAFLSSELVPDSGLAPAIKLTVDASLYEAAIQSMDIGVVEDDPSAGPASRVAGDTHFAFLVPERAFEDFIVLQELVARQAVSPRTALCLLLVDFTNPVFSHRRASLLAHIPDTVSLDGGADFHTRLRAGIANPEPTSAEAELLGLMDHSDLVGHAKALLRDYLEAVNHRLATSEGVLDIVRLADSRRHAFVSRRSLAEFRSTLAISRNPVTHLAMAADGSVFVKQTDLGEAEN